MKPADSIKHIIEKEYKLGGMGDAFDCLTVIVKFYRDIGCHIPDEFKGWTLGNYAERWKNGEGQDIYNEFLQSLGRPVEVNYMLEADLILICIGDALYPCIYLGNNHVLIISIETGTIVIPLWAIKSKIVEVRRLKDG